MDKINKSRTKTQKKKLSQKTELVRALICCQYNLYITLCFILVHLDGARRFVTRFMTAKTSGVFRDKRIHCSSSQTISLTSISNRIPQYNCEKRIFASSCLSIWLFECSPFYPSAQNKLAHNGRIFMLKFDEKIFLKIEE